MTATDPPAYTHSHDERLCADLHGRLPGHGPERPELVDIYAAPADRLDIHAALNTYETPEGAEPGFWIDGAQADLIGANGRRLIARETEDGMYVGGCLIKSTADARELAAFLTDWADHTAEWSL
jgi:hypothetical protein